jgi:hypothetical protein
LSLIFQVFLYAKIAFASVLPWLEGNLSIAQVNVVLISLLFSLEIAFVGFFFLLFFFFSIGRSNRLDESISGNTMASFSKETHKRVELSIVDVEVAGATHEAGKVIDRDTSSSV